MECIRQVRSIADFALEIAAPVTNVSIDRPLLSALPPLGIVVANVRLRVVVFTARVNAIMLSSFHGRTNFDFDGVFGDCMSPYLG